MHTFTHTFQSPMPDTVVVRRLRVRLVESDGPAASAPPTVRVTGGVRRPAGRRFRPWVVGPALLYRPRRGPGDRTPWRVDLHPGGRFLPVAPQRAADLERIAAWRRSEGLRCRLGVALVSCWDVAARHGEGSDGAPSPARLQMPAPGMPHGTTVDIYGWSLLYRSALADGAAVVDAHDEIDDLPAYYVSPAELADRAEHLAARGIACRPIALITAAEDFDAAPSTRNRFLPDGIFGRPADPRRLF